MSHLGSALRTLAVSAVIVMLTAGCGGAGGDATTAAATGGSTGSSGQGGPTISGQPVTTAMVGQAYSFQPTATGGSLTFSAQNLPSWLTLNASTGQLQGTPAAADVGTDASITISVSNGVAVVSLAPFSITVGSISTGSAVLTWTTPTMNADGSSLADLASFKILYGTSPAALNQTVAISNPTVTQYQIDNLSPGTWYFAIVTVNSSGVQSSPSNLTSTTI